MSTFNSAEFSGSQVGGGYMSSQTPMKTMGDSKMGGQTPGRLNRPENCLLPVMIEQINSAEDPKPDEAFMIDGTEVTQVTIVGKIIKIDVQSVNTTLTVSDGTGELEVKIWAPTEDSQTKQNEQKLLEENNTVRVIGKIKIFRGSRNMQSYRVLEVKSEDEIEMHKVESQYAHLMNTSVRNNPKIQMSLNEKNGLTVKTSNVSTNNNNFGIGNGNNNKMNSVTNNINSISNITPMDVDLDEISDFTPLQQKVYTVIKKSPHNNPNSDSGCNVENIFKLFPKVDINDVKDAVEFLVNEGKLYSTIDDEHYKTTDI